MDANETLWPGWETVRLIGRGSFGAVYEIRRDVFGEVEKAALKVISIPQNDSDIREMFADGYDEESITSTFEGHLKSIVAEYSLMRKMNGSSNVVNCDDFRYVQHDDGYGWDIYIKMELLTPLTDALPVAITDEFVIRLAKDMCSALELCQKYNIIHRDIKPQNIFVSPNGDYKLGDFGIAKTVEKTMGGTKTGTYKYMAPEVYNNQPYGGGADIYSLGLVLYWLLNERRMPFMPLPPAKLKAGMDEESRNRRLAGEQIPAPKNGSEELRRIVLKACAFDPKDRYQSAAEMLAELNALGATPSPAPAGEKQPEQKQAHISTDAPILPDEEEGGTVGPVFTVQKTIHPADVADDDGTMGPMFDPKTNAKSQKPSAAKHGTNEGTNLQIASKPISANNRGAFKFILAAILAVFLLFALVSVLPRERNASDTTAFLVEGVHNHTWSDATCTSPRVCISCGIQEGGTLAHQWTQADCVTPRMCNICGIREGTPLGHVWEPATLRLPQICSRCGQTEGTPIPTQHLVVEDEVAKIGQEFSIIRQNIDRDNYTIETPLDGIRIYRNTDGEIRCAIFFRGTEGIGDLGTVYSRSYYFADGKLIFAFFEGKHSQRFYFYEGYLMRWRYTESSLSNTGSVNHDLEFSDEFLAWEALIFEEIATLTYLT